MAYDDATALVDQVLKMRNTNTIAIDQGPTTKDQSTGYLDWARLGEMIGSPYTWVNIPLPKLYQMRVDAMIAFALQFIKVPLIRAPWYIQCQDAQVASFVDNALRRIYASFILQYTNSLDFGYAPIIKRFELDTPDWTYISGEDPDNPETPVWNAGDVKAKVWKRFTPIAPENAFPEWTDKGDFNGFKYNRANHALVPIGKAPTVDIWHALWVTNDREKVFGSLYGYPRIAYAYRYWWSSAFRWALADRAFEKHVDPALVVWYPDEQIIDDATGEAVNPVAQALAAGSLIRSGSTVAVPGTRVRDSNGEPTREREWGFDYLKAEVDFRALHDSFDYLDVLKLRACLVPEQAVIEGSGGTSSRNVAAQMNDTLNQSQYLLKAEIDDFINRFLIPQLVALNFPERKVECKIVTRGFASVDQEMQAQLLQLIGQGDPEKLNMVNLRALLEQGNVPVLSPDEVAAANAEAIEAQQQAAGAGLPEGEVPPEDLGEDESVITDEAPPGGVNPPTVEAGFSDAGPGYVPGITDHQGTYIQQREVIHLSTPHEFRQKVQKQYPHFRDSENFDALEDLYDLWSDALDEAYVGIASAVRSVNFAEDGIDVALGPVDVPEFLIKRVAEPAAKAYAKAVKKTVDFYMKIMFNTGRKEAQRVGFAPNDLKEFNEARRWAERRTGLLSDMLTETTEREVQSILSNILSRTTDPKEVSERVKEHFAEFPRWKAERITRGESSMAAGMAVLLAGKKLGVKRAKASDASGGTNRKTDRHCIERNGKTFTIEQAIKELESAHANCTLQWTLIPPTTKHLSEPNFLRRILGI